MPSWWRKLWDGLSKPEAGAADPSPPEPDLETAQWMDADAPDNPFDYDVLNLMVTQTLIATSRDADQARTCMQWQGSLGTELDLQPSEAWPPIPCEIEFPLSDAFPDGILFAPSSMEQRWVLCWREPHLIAARSWTGRVDAVASGRVANDRLLLTELRLAEDSPLRMGPVASTFEWLVRTHALRQKIPFPAHEEGAASLERTPPLAFTAFGDLIFCASKVWRPPPFDAPLCSRGAVQLGCLKGDARAIEAAVKAGEPVDAPGPGGMTALLGAVARGDPALVELLLRLGADPSRRADGGGDVFSMATRFEAPPEIFERLRAAGAPVDRADSEGFNALHFAAEPDYAEMVPWLVENGVDIEARNGHGLTPLHVACGLGRTRVARALLEMGADLEASSPHGTPLELAEREGHAEAAELLKCWTSDGN
jgi:ankyrin repeat protein